MKRRWTGVVYPLALLLAVLFLFWQEPRHEWVRADSDASPGVQASTGATP